MRSKLLWISDDFCNIRGSFRIGGLINVGTQVSLVRRANGKFVFLDSYTLDDQRLREIDELTRGGKNIEAVLNVHPFHTVHVEWMHQRYPHAKHYGTARHLSRFPALPWQKIGTESRELHTLFEEDFDFSVPRGVDFISANENVHFSSVMVLHRASQTIHVDDTLMHIALPFGRDATNFHLTLGKALEKRAGAAQDFRAWATELAQNWGGAQNLCAAHTAPLLATTNRGASIRERILRALDKSCVTLSAHEKKYG